MKYEKLYDDPGIDKHITAASEIYDEGNMEKMLGVGLNMPFESANSASRKNMFSSQYQQHVCLEDAEIPYISTGYENLFGQHSSSFIKADRNWTVIGKVEKFSNRPGHHYFLFVIDEQNNMDVIERVSYCHNTESYGFLYNNDYLDSLQINSVIPKSKTIKKSKSFDIADNYMAGRNLRVAYIADARTTEDAIEISKSASLALSRPEIKQVNILINDNDIPLNLYGDDNEYKILPDIGEEIKKGIVCGVRTEKNDEIFFTQSAERLKSTLINDTTFKTKGRIIDINIYCNKDISETPNGIYEGQLDFYMKDNVRFYNEVCNLLKNYIDNSSYKKSHELSRLYTRCEDVLSGKQYFKDNLFSNIYIELIVYRSVPADDGDKITSRYGGKGVISKVIDDELMPRISGTDEIVDLIWNQSTCVNRLNVGQLFETSLNFISSNIVNYILTVQQDTEMCIDMLYRYFSILSDDWARYFMDNIESSIDDDEAMFNVASCITENWDGLYIPLEPISEAITFDTLLEIYKEFPWIKPVFIDVPIKGSRGQIRWVQSNKPSIIAKQYIYRMKQNAEEKHSATSMSATNIKGLNSKSKAAKMFMRVHSNTPIRNGEMESNIFSIMGMEVQIKQLMLYSTSPQARRNAKQMLKSFEFNVTLDEDGKSRSAEILNASIKAMGVRVEFKKVPIRYINVANEQTECALFRFLDWDKNQLFIECGKNADKLFQECGKNSEQLFIECGKNADKLFKYMGDD